MKKNVANFSTWLSESKFAKNLFMMNKKIISKVQEVLVEKGYMHEKINPNKQSVDGVYGPITRASILAYQADFDLEANGLINEELIDHMNIKID